MRSVCLGLVGLTLVLLVGCSSNNKGKLEGTKWSNQEATIKDKPQKAGVITIEFKPDESLVYRFTGPDGQEQDLRGKYALKRDDFVVLTFDTQLAGRKVHTEKVSINGEVMTMTDSDGTAVLFDRVRE